MVFRSFVRAGLLLGILTPLLFGFRLIPLRFWDLQRSPASERKLFVVYPDGGRMLENNLSADDPLASAGSTLSVDQLMTSVFNDFNGIQSAFVELVPASDTDFAAFGARRTITLSNADAAGLSSGEAAPELDGRQVIGCKINLTDQVYKDAAWFIGVVTHEIGHCLGLDHPQETVHAVMSYFGDTDRIARLQIDDKMGLTHLYPEQETYGRERATFGLSCARSD
jgi:hypothetical protein